jgi:hypothetical protein
LVCVKEASSACSGWRVQSALRVRVLVDGPHSLDFGRDERRCEGVGTSPTPHGTRRIGPHGEGHILCDPTGRRSANCPPPRSRRPLAHAVPSAYGGARGGRIIGGVSVFCHSPRTEVIFFTIRTLIDRISPTVDGSKFSKTMYPQGPQYNRPRQCRTSCDLYEELNSLMLLSVPRVSSISLPSSSPNKWQIVQIDCSKLRADQSSRAACFICLR